MNVKDYVVQELESYPRTLRQIAVLRYELEHPVQVSTEEMLDAMAFARGEHFGVAPGHVSDKTLYRISCIQENDTLTAINHLM